jgi:hypothetical protein
MLRTTVAPGRPVTEEGSTTGAETGIDALVDGGAGRETCADADPPAAQRNAVVQSHRRISHLRR